MSDAINNSSTGLIKRVTALEQGGSAYEPDITYTNVGSLSLDTIYSSVSSYNGGTVYYSRLYQNIIVKNVQITMRKAVSAGEYLANSWFMPNAIPNIYRPNGTQDIYYNTAGANYFYLYGWVNGSTTYTSKYVLAGIALTAGTTYTCSFKLDWPTSAS